MGRAQAVHSGADLQASAKGASGELPQGAKEHLGYVLTHAQDHIILPLMENAVEARTELQPHIAGHRCKPQLCPHLIAVFLLQMQYIMMPGDFNLTCKAPVEKQVYEIG